MNIKSPLRYPGGKSKAIKYIKNFFPEFEELREPFFGGGSVSFHVLQTFKNIACLASDINYELYCFWNILKTNPKKLIDGVQNIYDSFEGGKALFNLLCKRRETNLTELERAIDFYVLNRITFSGVVDSGGYSEGSFQGRFTQSSIDRLSEVSKVIQNIHFICEDYTHLLNMRGEDVFIFLDPPYYTATNSRLYGKNGILHLNFDHESLFNALKKCPFKWLITYDNSEYIKDLYKNNGYYFHEWELQYGMNNYKKNYSAKGRELLIANYDLDQTFRLNKERGKLNLEIFQEYSKC